jgi:hypothetical protein
VLARYFGSVSDERIKTNIRSIDDGVALNELRNIDPVTYNYKDFIAYGSTTVMGFIAQQVATYLPQAISLTSDYIPNIYNVFDVSMNQNTICVSTFSSVSELDSNSEILMYTPENIPINGRIQTITESNLTIQNVSDPVDTTISTLFFYGSCVNNFYTLNKDYLFTINVAATQELDRIIQENDLMLSDLEAKVSTLKG